MSAFESEEVFERSCEIRALLLRHDFPSTALLLEPVSMERYRECCRSAAECFAAEAMHRRVLRISPPLGAAPEVGQRSKDFAARALEVMTTEMSERMLEERAEEAISRKATGAVEYMLCVSGRLRDAVRRLCPERRGWNAESVEWLAVLLRYYLNEELGKCHGALFAPALGRAKMIEGRSIDLIDSLGELVRDAAEKYRLKCLLGPRPLGVPAIGWALAKQSGGDVEAVLKQAAEARNAAVSLRRDLRTLADALMTGTGEKLREADTRLRQLSRSLYRELGLRDEETARQGSGVTLQANILGLSMSCSGEALSSVFAKIRQIWKKRRVAVLARMAENLAFTGVDDADVKRFFSACLRGTHSSR